MRPEFFVTSSHDFIPWEQFATLTLSPLQYFGTLNSLAQPKIALHYLIEVIVRK